MRLQLTRQAVRDIQGIADFIGAESPSAAHRARTRILETLRLLGEYPELGRVQALRAIRKAIVPGYGYLIYYHIDPASREVVVLTVRHPARRRPPE
jgi:toxin ParE1/3/4